MNVQDDSQIRVTRILVIDSGPGVARIVAKVQSLGYRAVLLSESEAGDRYGADEVAVGDCLEHEVVIRAIVTQVADAVFPPFGHGSIPAAFAAHHCGFTALSMTAAATIECKHIAFATLGKRGVPLATWRYAPTAEAAQDAAGELGMPVWLGAAATYSEASIHEVVHLEDISLAFARVTRRSPLKAAVVMRPLRGLAFYVDGVVVDGTFRLSGVIERDMGDAPFLFDRALFVSAALSLRERNVLVDAAVKALDALKFRNGCVHVGVILTDDGPVVLEVFGAPAALRFPADLLLLAHGTDTIGNAVRFALGEEPVLGSAVGRSAALCWIPTHSGVVTEIRGVEEARAIPGVEAVVVGVGPGDAMRHVVDCESRDRVGYVLAAGDDAMGAARQALAVIEIVTKPSY